MPAVSPTETTRQGLFTSTRWTMVLDAGESQTPPEQALNALSELCRIYWRPIFAPRCKESLERTLRVANR